jgi:hypothetical protein
MISECRLHPTADHFGPGTHIFRCSHFGHNFVVAFIGRWSKVFVDYVHIGEDAVTVESHDCLEWEEEFKMLEAKMLDGTPPNPELE